MALGVISSVEVPSRQEVVANSAPKALSEEGRLAMRLMELVGVPAKSSLQFMLQSHFRTSVDDAQDAAHFILKSLRLLGKIGHQSSEIAVYSVHAAAYLVAFADRFESDGMPKMRLEEFVRVFCLCLYVAHTHIEDATFSLKDWHSQLFGDYCSLKILNFSVMSLLEKLDFSLRIDEDVLRDHLHFLKFGTKPRRLPSKTMSHMAH